VVLGEWDRQQAGERGGAVKRKNKGKRGREVRRSWGTVRISAKRERV